MLAALSACSSSVEGSGNASAGESRTEEATSAEIGETMETTVGVAPVREEGGPSGAPFVTKPEAGGGWGYDADTMLAVRYGAHEGYERVVIDLGTGKEPAETVPGWTLVSPAGEGLVRVTLPSVSATGVSDGKLGDGLLKSFYVVRAPEGGMFVDILARETLAYRVLELSEPARLVVDFKPLGKPLRVPLPRAGGETVLVEPRAGARISTPLTVSGYSRNFEASNTVVLSDPRGKVVARQTITSNDWTSTWGYFEATLDLHPFSGEGTLRVGTGNARDGTFEGVEVPVRGG